MNRIKKFILTGLAVLAVGALSACSKPISQEDVLARVKSAKTITWGVKNDTRLFGFMNIKTGHVEGFDIDIAKAVTKKIAGADATPVFVEVTSKTRIPLLKNGNIDAIIATMTITEERKKQVLFSEPPYFEAGQSLLVKKDSPIQSVKDLKAGTTVLAVKGSTSVANIQKVAPEAKVLELENYAECFTALKSGQGDVMTTDNAILLGMAAEDPDYHLVGGNFTDEPYGIAVNLGQEPFVDAINQALADMRSDGTYQKIYDKWFGGVDQ